jgi:hypothetical protein
MKGMESKYERRRVRDRGTKGIKAKKKESERLRYKLNNFLLNLRVLLLCTSFLFF